MQYEFIEKNQDEPADKPIWRSLPYDTDDDAGAAACGAGPARPRYSAARFIKTGHGQLRGRLLRPRRPVEAVI